jgi:hypothetical protein
MTTWGVGSRAAIGSLVGLGLLMATPRANSAEGDVRCGSPGWEQFRNAVEAFCSSGTMRNDKNNPPICQVVKRSFAKCIDGAQVPGPLKEAIKASDLRKKQFEFAIWHQRGSYVIRFSRKGSNWVVTKMSFEDDEPIE